MSTDTINVLNKLIETSKNGEKGFQISDEDTENTELKALFRRHAQDCGASAAELQRLVSSLGGKPETEGTMAGAVHRGWLKLRAAVSSRTDTAILEECERGEDLAKKQYLDALEEDLPENIRSIVQKQYEGVVRTHDEIRDLRNRYRQLEH